MNAKLKRIQAIEQRAHTTSPELDEREQRHRDMWMAIFAAFPPSLRRRYLDSFQEYRDDITEHHGLFGLYCLVSDGDWEPRPLPEPLAQLYLDYPDAGPGRRCLGCKLPLPERWGLFVKRATGKRTYGPLRYLDACPGCGGTEFKSWMPWDPTWYAFPAMPNEVYDFEDQVPRERLPRRAPRLEGKRPRMTS